METRRKERKKKKKIQIQIGWGKCLRSHSTTGLPGPGSAEPFPKDEGSLGERWPWMAELRGEGDGTV